LDPRAQPTKQRSQRLKIDNVQIVACVSGKGKVIAALFTNWRKLRCYTSLPDRHSQRAFFSNDGDIFNPVAPKYTHLSYAAGQQLQ